MTNLNKLRIAFTFILLSTMAMVLFFSEVEPSLWSILFSIAFSVLFGFISAYILEPLSRPPLFKSQTPPEDNSDL